jgi:hypothetical protein
MHTNQSPNALPPTATPAFARLNVLAHQSSHIVSRFKSLLFSAPHTLHLFLLSLLPNPELALDPNVSKLPLLMPLPSTPPFAAARNRSILSASIAASSASGESGIVSSEEMDGERERADVGVEGTEEDVRDVVRMYGRSEGNASLKRVALKSGEPVLEALVGVLTRLDTWCSGEAGRRRLRGKVFECCG